MAGVNYGNRFIPEDWMANDQESIYGTKYGARVDKPGNVGRVSLCDVEDDRILRYLDEKVQEDDFKLMQSYGVKLLRVPTGYWNWIELGGATPNAPSDVAQRYKNLQKVKPAQYEPYIDKIYQYGQKYGIKIFMELHGAPGSQNGEIHSGCVTGADRGSQKPKHYFNTYWNLELALRTVDKLSAKCKQYGSTCWGVGVLNEPQPSGSNEDLHNFLDKYYPQAIKKAREHLSPDVPVVLFSWTYDFDSWSSNHFPSSQYGNVLWDTHAYYGGSQSADDALKSYDYDIGKIVEF